MSAVPARPRTATLAFAVAGGAAAWFVQMTVHFALFNLPCFPGPERNTSVPADAQWIWPAGILLYVVCLLVALAAGWVSLGLYRAADAHPHGGRTRFLAFWGLLLDGGLAFLILANGVGLLMVPPCVN